MELPKHIRHRLRATTPLEHRTTPENPSFDINSSMAWDLFTEGGPSAAGVAVNHTKAIGVPPLWQGVSMISGDIARMPLNVYRRGDDEDDDREVDKAHPAHRIVRRQWNDETAAFFGWRTLVVHAVIWGNGYAYIARNGRGDPAMLINLLPDRTNAERINGEKVFVTETTRQDGSPWLRPIPARDVFHLPGMSVDGMSGVDVVKQLRDSLGLAIAAAGFASKFFKNGVRSGGILEVPAAMGTQAVSRLEEGFRKQYEGEANWFKTIVLRDGAKFHQLTIPPAEGQMTETREAQAREVANILNLAPSLLGIPGGGGYNSQMEEKQRYLDSTLSPWLEAIVSECWMKLLSGAQQDADSHYFEHTTDKLLSMNPLQRWQVYAMAVRNQCMVPNEVRRKENLPSVEWGDEPVGQGLQPGSSDGGVDKQGNETPRGPQDETDGEAPASEAARMRRVVFGFTRQARHKATKPAAFLEWIDGNCVSHRQEAIAAIGQDQRIDEMLTELRRIAEVATQDKLASVVSEWAERVEMAI